MITATASVIAANGLVFSGMGVKCLYFRLDLCMMTEALTDQRFVCACPQSACRFGPLLY